MIIAILLVLKLVAFYFLDLLLLVDKIFEGDLFVNTYDNGRPYSRNLVVESTSEFMGQNNSIR